MNINSLDALLGLLEPWLLGLNTMGIAGVSIFFFLSSFLVWTSWARDPNVKRFFWRRSLRIFPALWVVTLASVFVLGLTITVLSAHDYFAAPSTWQYLRTVVLVSPNTLPRLFPANLLPYVVNGSLWTLPDEYFCYVTFAVVGSVIGIVKAPRRVALAGAARRLWGPCCRRALCAPSGNGCTILVGCFLWVLATSSVRAMGCGVVCCGVSRVCLFWIARCQARCGTGLLGVDGA